MSKAEDTLNLKERLALLTELGQRLRGEDEYLDALMQRTQFNNPWFTLDNQKAAVRLIAEDFLERGRLEEWLGRYALPAEQIPRTVGIVMAGNIPLVGFHDWLCVFTAGHRSQVKLSEKDQYLFPYLIELLGRMDERSRSYTDIVPRLSGFDAVIATGSNNSARYFEAYFDRYPNIIRKNRHGVAVLSGKESPEELLALGKDIFQYFGLGCRNVAKLYLPKDYDFDPLLEALHEYREIVLNTKYKNNFDYNYALFMLNRRPFKANGCVLLLEEESLSSRIACLHYEHYDSLADVEQQLQARQAEIQCVIAQPGLLSVGTFGLGQAQSPALWDYADGIDTLEFLKAL